MVTAAAAASSIYIMYVCACVRAPAYCSRRLSGAESAGVGLEGGGFTAPGLGALGRGGGGRTTAPAQDVHHLSTSTTRVHAPCRPAASPWIRARGGGGTDDRRRRRTRRFHSVTPPTRAHTDTHTRTPRPTERTVRARSRFRFVCGGYTAPKRRRIPRRRGGGKVAAEERSPPEDGANLYGFFFFFHISSV